MSGRRFLLCKKLIHQLFLVINSFLLLALINSSNAEGQPCLNGWGYRVPITIVNSTPNTFEDFQVSITINTQSLIANSKMNIGGNDIRFLTTSGVVIPHWIESSTLNSPNTKIWVKIPSLVASASETVYLFYGNLSVADISNGELTFDFFDNFNNGGVNNGKWSTCNGGEFSQSNGMLKLSSTNASNKKAIVRSLNNFSGPLIAEMFVSEVSGVGAYIGFADSENKKGYGLFYEEGMPNTMRMVLFDKDINCHSVNNQFPSADALDALDVRGIWSISWLAKGKQLMDWPNAPVHPVTRTDDSHDFPSSVNLLIGQSENTGSVFVDWVRVRKYAASEPTVSLGVEASLANIALVSSNSPICEGGDLKLSSNKVIGAEYSWKGPQGFSSSEQNPMISGATPGTSGTYELTISIPSGCAPVKSSVEVIVDKQTASGNLSGGGAACQGGNSGKILLDENIGTPIRWESSISGFAPWTTITTSDSFLDYVNLTQTTYFRAVVKSGVCSVKFTNPEIVEVAPAAKGGSIMGPLPVCSGINIGSLELIGHLGEIAEWQSTTDNWNTFTPIDTTNPSFSFSNLHETTQFRVLIKSGSCPSVFSTPYVVVVHPLPSVDFDAPPVCDMIPMRFKNNSSILSGQISSFIWDFGDGSNSIEEKPSHLFLNPGVYEVKLKATSAFGCFKDTSKKVTVNELPVANFSAKGVCLEKSVFFENLSSFKSGSINYLWKFDDGNTSDNFSPEHLYLSSGSYNVILYATSGSGCKDSLIKPIDVYPLPKANAGSDTTISRGFGVMLQATGGEYYVWSPLNGLNNSNISNPIANPEETTTYVVKVISEQGCEALDTVVVNISKDYKLIVSNIITPDGNGSNDTWVVSNIESFKDESHVKVYSRWGKEVFSKDGYNNDWAGVEGADILPDGTYYYIISFDRSDTVYRGAITILRNKK